MANSQKLAEKKGRSTNFGLGQAVEWETWYAPDYHHSGATTEKRILEDMQAVELTEVELEEIDSMYYKDRGCCWRQIRSFQLPGWMNKRPN